VKAAAQKDAVLRARALAEQRIEYIDHPAFPYPKKAAALISASVPEFGELIQAPHGLPAYLTSLYEVPLLSKQSEEVYFAKMNYLKYRGNQLRQTLNLKRPSITKVNEVERLLSEATNIRNRIVQANLRLVVAIAKKFADHSNSLEDLVSEGHLPLIRAVELFDFSRGFRFSTYATWAIRNHFVRATTDKRKLQNRYSTSDPFIFERASEKRPAVNESEGKLNHRKQVVDEFLNRLQPREQSILAARYGLADHGQPQTLSEIGRDLGISKERVRQLSLRALGKLQEIAAVETVELPEG
jgi:RNA polymerase sigma factor (sigma-70 family)